MVEEDLPSRGPVREPPLATLPRGGVGYSGTVTSRSRLREVESARLFGAVSARRGLLKATFLVRPSVGDGVNYDVAVDVVFAPRVQFLQRQYQSASFIGARLKESRAQAVLNVVLFRVLNAQ